MNRYFFQISYDGTEYSGWQRQENAITVQECIEENLSRLYKDSIPILGCGRTDAGVHASDFYFHVDLNESEEGINLLRFKLNKMLPSTVSVNEIIPVHKEAHARFDATSRSYIYRLHFDKDPFSVKYSFKYNQGGIPDFDLLSQAASLIKEYTEFYPFCKSNSDVLNYKCQIEISEWKKITESKWEYHVTANRFLRGMVRLIVGMCLNVAIGKILLHEVREAMDKQERLKYAWSVPPQGLSLTDIQYPYITKN